jgi:hypothetical protein
VGVEVIVAKPGQLVLLLALIIDTARQA